VFEECWRSFIVTLSPQAKGLPVHGDLRTAFQEIVLMG
jgi:hypothetical protein